MTKLEIKKEKSEDWKKKGGLVHVSHGLTEDV
jgi:hypothetical protein